MKIFFLFIVAAALANTSFAQEESSKGNTIPRAASVSKSTTVAKEGTVTAFRKTLVPGKLNLQKAYEKTESDFFATVYTLQSTNDGDFNSNKPVHISLTRKSYDSVFTKGSSTLAARYAVLNQFITAKSISLDTEEGWIALIKYYNNL